MIAMVAHELRTATRWAGWPAVIAMHLSAAALFIAVWGPTNGVPLWTAPLLTQLVAADRLLLAVLLTWLTTPMLAPGAEADLAGWSAVTGMPAASVMGARAAAAVVMALALVTATAPIAMAAAEMSGPASPSLAAALGDMAAFALLTVGVTAAGAVVWRDALAVWAGSMALTAIAAVGLRLLSGGPARIALCLAIAAAGVALLTAAARRRYRWIDEASR